MSTGRSDLTDADGLDQFVSKLNERSHCMPRPDQTKATPQQTKEELQDQLLELLVTKIIELVEAAKKWVERH